MTDEHMTQSDVDFAVFLATRKVYKVQRERPIQSIAQALIRRYDQVTDNKLTLIRGQQMKANVSGE
jgi:hypothetical protein